MQNLNVHVNMWRLKYCFLFVISFKIILDNFEDGSTFNLAQITVFIKILGTNRNFSDFFKKDQKYIAFNGMKNLAIRLFFQLFDWSNLHKADNFFFIINGFGTKQFLDYRHSC